MWSVKDKKEYQAWLDEKEAIERAAPNLNETEKERDRRIKKLLKSFPDFANYYFSHLIDCDFAPFQIKAATHVIDNPDTFDIEEWPREHAKSIIFDVMVPMMLKARGELTGMMIASCNEVKASKLLGDLQAELMFNKRYIADFGEQYSVGNWKDGMFITADGIAFWAFGRGQSPRGAREGKFRPNYGVGDDLDDAVIVRNEARVNEAVDWFLGDFYGCMPNTGSRLLAIGNRIHSKGILAKLVGDVDVDTPKREGIYHSKVFALQDSKGKSDPQNGEPAWKRYTRDQIWAKMRRMGWRIGLREFFHQHIVEGRVFKDDQLVWGKCPSIQECDIVVTYNDPSYKAQKNNDFKSIVLMGRKGRFFYIYKAFVRQCTTPAMVRGHYELASHVPSKVACRHYMEANFIQDLMLEEYWKMGEQTGKFLRIRGDLRAKPEKTARIETLTAFTEARLLIFNEEEKSSPDMQELRNQFLGFPDMEHDDGPDSVEGAIEKLNKSKKKEGKKTKTVSGTYKKNSNRRA
jgi:predicted phage terminase large subunit-like protein